MRIDGVYFGLIAVNRIYKGGSLFWEGCITFTVECLQKDYDYSVTVSTDLSGQVTINSGHKVTLKTKNGKLKVLTINLPEGYSLTQALDDVSDIKSGNNVPLDLQATNETSKPIDTEIDLIPTFEDDVSRVRKKLDKIKADAGDDELVMWSFMTDTHDNGSSADTMDGYENTTEDRRLVNEQLISIAEDYGFSAILHGGDSVGYGTDKQTGYTEDGKVTALPSKDAVPELNAVAMERVKEALVINTDAFKNTDIPFLYTSGNHDVMGSGVRYNVYINPEETYPITVGQFANRLSYVDEEHHSTNCYYDDIIHKFRFISIDRFWDDNHNQWEGENINLKHSFAKMAIESAPSDYKIVIFGHCGIGPSFYGSNADRLPMTYTDPNSKWCTYDKYLKDYDLMTGYKNFDNILVLLNGHSHENNQALTYNGKFCINSEAASVNTRSIFGNRNDNWDIQGDSPEHARGYASMTAVDVFVYNKKTGKLDIVRIGNGADREFNIMDNKFYYGSITATLTSRSETDLSNYRLCINSNPRKDWDLEKMYKHIIKLKPNSEGYITSENKDALDDVPNKIGVPINTDLSIKILRNENNNTLFVKELGIYNWNKNNNYTINLGEVSVDIDSSGGSTDTPVDAEPAVVAFTLGSSTAGNSGGKEATLTIAFSSDKPLTKVGFNVATKSDYLETNSKTYYTTVDNQTEGEAVISFPYNYSTQYLRVWGSTGGATTTDSQIYRFYRSGKYDVYNK